MKDLFDIYAIQKDSGKLHSLLLELEEVEQWQKELQYRKGVPEQPTESEWYKEEKKRLECEITWYESKVQEDRKALDLFLATILIQQMKSYAIELSIIYPGKKLGQCFIWIGER